LGDPRPTSTFQLQLRSNSSPPQPSGDLRVDIKSALALAPPLPPKAQSTAAAGRRTAHGTRHTVHYRAFCCVASNNKRGEGTWDILHLGARGHQEPGGAYSAPVASGEGRRRASTGAGAGEGGLTGPSLFFPHLSFTNHNPVLSARPGFGHPNGHIGKAVKGWSWWCGVACNTQAHFSRLCVPPLR
jgi:hypothetical protein